MPLQVTVNDATRFVRFVGRDPMTVDDIVANIQMQVRTGAWGYASLVDLTAVTWVPTPQEVDDVLSSIRRLSEQHGPRGRIAFAVANPAVYGMLRMYGMKGESFGVTSDVFHTVDQAEAWLGVR